MMPKNLCREKRRKYIKQILSENLTKLSQQNELQVAVANTRKHREQILTENVLCRTFRMCLLQKNRKIHNASKQTGIFGTLCTRMKSECRSALAEYMTTAYCIRPIRRCSDEPPRTY